MGKEEGRNEEAEMVRRDRPIQTGCAGQDCRRPDEARMGTQGVPGCVRVRARLQDVCLFARKRRFHLVRFHLVLRSEEKGTRREEAIGRDLKEKGCQGEIFL